MFPFVMSIHYRISLAETGNLVSLSRKMISGFPLCAMNFVTASRHALASRLGTTSTCTVPAVTQGKAKWICFSSNISCHETLNSPNLMFSAFDTLQLHIFDESVSKTNYPISLRQKTVNLLCSLVIVIFVRILDRFF